MTEFIDNRSLLSFFTLRTANTLRLPLFKNAKGEIAHPTVEGQAVGADWSLGEWVTAVVGELGELANVIKKVKRGDFTLEEARPQLAAELADVVCYLDILGMQLGVDIGRAVFDKFNVVSDRVGAPVKFTQFTRRGIMGCEGPGVEVGVSPTR